MEIPDVDNIFFPLELREWQVVFHGYFSAPDCYTDPNSRVYTNFGGQRPSNPDATEVPTFNPSNVIK